MWLKTKGSHEMGDIPLCRPKNFAVAAQKTLPPKLCRLIYAAKVKYAASFLPPM